LTAEFVQTIWNCGITNVSIVAVSNGTISGITTYGEKFPSTRL
jgi:hypothetical protein